MKTPEGVEAEFSQPVMVTATFLTGSGFSLSEASDIAGLCAGQQYSTEIPPFRSLLDRHAGNYLICIRVRLGSATKTLQSPVFHISDTHTLPEVDSSKTVSPTAKDISGIHLIDGVEKIVLLAQAEPDNEPVNCQIAPGMDLLETTPCNCVDFTCSVGIINNTGFTGLTLFSFTLSDKNGETSTATAHVRVSETLPPDPANLSSSSSEPGSLILSWESSGGSTAGYILSYQEGGQGPADCKGENTISLSADSTSYSLTGLKVNTDYGLRLCSVNTNPLPDHSQGVTLSGSTQMPGWYLSFDDFVGSFAKSSGLDQTGGKLMNGATI